MGDQGWEDPLEKGMATHSSILAWSWTEAGDFFRRSASSLFCDVSLSTECWGPQCPPEYMAGGIFTKGAPEFCDGDLREPLVRCQGSQVSMHVGIGSASLLLRHGRGIGPQDASKKDASDR